MNMFMGLRQLVTLLSLITLTSASNITTKIVTTLPGYSGDLPFTMETGLAFGSVFSLFLSFMFWGEHNLFDEMPQKVVLVFFACSCLVSVDENLIVVSVSLY